MNYCIRTEKTSDRPAQAVIVLTRAVSAFFRTLGWRSCRFHPSCSAYAAGAFGRFGFLKALRLTSGRLLRCHPFNAGGHDPLPDSPLRK